MPMLCGHSGFIPHPIFELPSFGAKTEPGNSTRPLPYLKWNQQHIGIKGLHTILFGCSRHSAFYTVDRLRSIGLALFTIFGFRHSSILYLKTVSPAS